MSKAISLSGMFKGSRFNQNINNWDVSGVKQMHEMFYDSRFNKPLNKWDVSNVWDMEYMFQLSKFNQDISMWNINPNVKVICIFKDAAIQKEFKPKVLRKYK